MSDNSETPKTAFGLTPLIALGYGAYYVSDTWGARWDTQGYGVLCMSVLVFLASVLAYRSFRIGAPVAALSSWVLARPGVVSAHWAAIVLSFSLILYAAVQATIGFLPASAAVFLWVMTYLRAGGPARIAFVGAGLTLLAWLTLQFALNVPLPTGPLGV